MPKLYYLQIRRGMHRIHTMYCIAQDMEDAKATAQRFVASVTGKIPNTRHFHIVNALCVASAEKGELVASDTLANGEEGESVWTDRNWI